MTFHDLPANSRDLPLDDPALRADLVDLLVPPEARDSGCLVLLMLDGAHRCEVPVLVDAMGPPDPERVRRVVERVLEELPVPAVVAALGRPGSPLFTDGDRACHQVVVDLCRERGVDLLATFVATDNVVRELPHHLRIAS